MTYFNSSSDLLTINDRPGQHAPSWYAVTAQSMPDHPSLKGETRADVCIVGGGYSGLSAALHLRERGYDVALVEAHRVGWGASGRNGGQLGSGQRIGQGELEARLGQGVARALWDLAEESKALAKSLIARHAIDCDLRPGILDAIHRPRFEAETREDVALLTERYAYPHIRFVGREEIRAMVASEDFHGGALDTDAAHLHPLNYALGLARAAAAAGVRLHEHSRVMRISGGPVSGGRVETMEGSVTAPHILLACNGYLCGLEGSVAARVMPINNFIVATEPLPDPAALIRDDVALCDSRFVVNYFRLSRDGRLLFGGGENYSYRFPADIAATVRKPLLRIFPQLADTRIDYAWGGTLAITMDRMPHFARPAPGILSISGYSGHGVGMATLAGKLAAEAIAGQAERFDLLASIPRPRFPGGIALRSPLLTLAMLWYGLKDRL